MRLSNFVTSYFFNSNPRKQEHDYNDIETLLEKPASSAGPRTDHDCEQKLTRTFSTVGVLLFFLLGVLSGFVGGFYWPQNLDKQCFSHIFPFSPVSTDIPITYHESHFNASLFKPSIYRGDPSPEIDFEWRKLGVYFSPISVNAQVAVRSGISLGHARAPKEAGEGYIANVEVFHQLHCLNLLRKTSYWNYDYYKNLGIIEFSNSDKTLKVHTGHCLDILRQKLMCTADITLLPYVRLKDYPEPYPDFNAVSHKCRNFDEILSWGMEHQVKTVAAKFWEEAQEGDDVLEEYP